LRIKIKRVYEPPERADGARILVDRLWPRGIEKRRAKIAAWMKDIAPSDALRRRFHGSPGRWTEFRRRYAVELRTKGALLERLLDLAKRGRVTLLYASRDLEHNNARALQMFLLTWRKPSPRRRDPSN
jgi:uncharacterized protein YeaO (DUF488 family)